MRGLLWRLPWFFFALMCLYILFYRWQLELLTLTPIAAVTTTRALMQQGQYAEAADEVAYFLARLRLRPTSHGATTDVGRPRLSDGRLNFRYSRTSRRVAHGQNANRGLPSC